MFRAYPFGFALSALSRYQVMPPDVVGRIPGRVAGGSFVNDDAVNELAAAQCQGFIYSWF